MLPPELSILIILLLNITHVKSPINVINELAWDVNNSQRYSQSWPIFRLNFCNFSRYKSLKRSSSSGDIGLFELHKWSLFGL